MCFEYNIKQYINNVIQCIFVEKILNLFECRNIHFNQIDDLLIQIRVQRFRSCQRFFDIDQKKNNERIYRNKNISQR